MPANAGFLNTAAAESFHDWLQGSGKSFTTLVSSLTGSGARTPRVLRTRRTMEDFAR
jgi:hypothetical protein